jgi:hypothetical protein
MLLINVPVIRLVELLNIRNCKFLNSNDFFAKEIAKPFVKNKEKTMPLTSERT